MGKKRERKKKRYVYDRKKYAREKKYVIYKKASFNLETQDVLGSWHSQEKNVTKCYKKL